MKWLKKWSFMTILAITGILYCGADRDLLSTIDWGSLIPIKVELPRRESVSDPALEGATGGGSQSQSDVEGEALQGGEGDQSGPEGGNLQGGESGQPGAEGGELQGDEGGQPGAEGGELQGGEGGQPGPEGADIQSGAPGQAEVGGESIGQQSQESIDLEETGQGEVPTEPEPTPEPEIVIGRVEEDYFTDALFLGDSRTVGMSQYGSLGEIATFYASTGMTIYKLLGAEIVEVPDSKEKITVEEALEHQSFSKIYIMMGINEVGSGTTESFAKAYGEVIARLQELQPDAIIYIEAIIRVTTARSAKGDYINNEAIGARNEALSQLADGEKIFYLDVNQAICDEDGGLIKDYTSDGVHLKAKYISLWEEYLKDNAVLLD